MIASVTGTLPIETFAYEFLLQAHFLETDPKCPRNLPAGLIALSGISHTSMCRCRHSRDKQHLGRRQY